jgi:hypothetical protein
MTHRTEKLSSYNEYLDEVYPLGAHGSAEDRVLDEREREPFTRRFPYTVVLKVSYPELDVSNRWCWKQFGPADGDCLDTQSEFRSCEQLLSHSHVGGWCWRWLAKTDYDFGYNEWYFESAEHRAAFLRFVPEITCGEKYAR